MKILMTLILLIWICSESYGQVTDKYFFMKDGTVITGPLSNIVQQTQDRDTIYVLLASTVTLTIAQTDLDYYNYTGVPNSTKKLELAKQPSFKIYPNPTKNVINVSYKLEKTGEVSILLYDLQGRALGNWNKGEQSAGEYVETIQLRDYPSGVYFLRMLGEGYESSQKLIIQN
jgi:hypothetical protein